MSRDTLIELAKDAPLPTAVGLTLAGVPVETWILWLTVAWAVFRLASAGIDLYQKLKAMYEQSRNKRSNGTPARGADGDDPHRDQSD